MRRNGLTFRQLFLAMCEHPHNCSCHLCREFDRRSDAGESYEQED